MNGDKYRSTRPVPPWPPAAPWPGDPRPVHPSPLGNLHFRNLPFPIWKAGIKNPWVFEDTNTYEDVGHFRGRGGTSCFVQATLPSFWPSNWASVVPPPGPAVLLGSPCSDLRRPSQEVSSNHPL